LFLLRILSYNLLIIPGFNKSELLGTALYRIQSISVFFYPALFAHLFYLLLYKNNKNFIIIITSLYCLSLIFYVSTLIGINPITKDLKVENDKIQIIINTSSYIYKTVIIYFTFSYIFSIYLLSKYSKNKILNKDRKTIGIMKWTYIVIYGYGYILQFFISLIKPEFISLTQYLIIIFSIVIYYTITRYNFLKIYKTSQFSNLIIEDLTIPFIITNEKGLIIRSNTNNDYNNFFDGKNIFSIFTESGSELHSCLDEGIILKNINLNLVDLKNQVEVTYTVDINPIKDKFMDIIGLFITLSDYKISLNSFSSREQEIINYLTKGSSYKEIAYELNISYNTVNSHVKKIYKKSGVNERKELIDFLDRI